MKITRFKDIPQLTRAETYNTNIPLTHILKTLSEWEEDEYYHLQVNYPPLRSIDLEAGA